MIANSSLPGEYSSENPGLVAQTIKLYRAADNYCREHGGSVENLFPAIARDFKEMKAIKYEVPATIFATLHCIGI